MKMKVGTAEMENSCEISGKSSASNWK